MAESFEELRCREFARLDAQGHVYLDYTGAGLYAESQVRAHADFLSRGLYGNPHSRNPTSQAATKLVEDARLRVLDFFHADPEAYEVVFTLNASGALKLVGEAYPFEPGSRFLLTADNHNSVNGLREFAAAHGAEVAYVPLGPELRVPDVERHLAGAPRDRHNLFAFPAQSNFSGVKHPLEWTELAAAHGYHTLLDAAAFVPTSRLDLREHRPDFVCLSFYKMFGFPTGVGALLARRNALGELHRPWFSGGTVRFVSAQNQVHLQHVTARAFEDGTLNYLGIAAVPQGLDFLEGIGIERINAHVMRLTARLLDALRGLRHGNGAPMVCVYGPGTTEGRGGTVAFNLMDPAGELIDFRAVEQRANDAMISLRSGFFCNPGAAEFAFEYPDEDAFRCIQTLTPETFNIQVFSDCMSDHPVGAIRVSVGIASNEADVARLMEVLAGFRDCRAGSESRTPLPALATVD
ncbi:MAG TPA: aminotransferase class V-fold PLP-dependent enzyme [Longimicrobium sp.]|nr:aminotransferase class V-fold PLP-dependent enzyme [Longimicrobium sp.]